MRYQCQNWFQHPRSTPVSLWWHAQVLRVHYEASSCGGIVVVDKRLPSDMDRGVQKRVPALETSEKRAIMVVNVTKVTKKKPKLVENDLKKVVNDWRWLEKVKDSWEKLSMIKESCGRWKNEWKRMEKMENGQKWVKNGQYWVLIVVKRMLRGKIACLKSQTAEKEPFFCVKGPKAGDRSERRWTTFVEYVSSWLL